MPEKWEGLAIGPRLKGGHYLLLAGTDNDYSVTQNAGGEQFDVYFRFTDPTLSLVDPVPARRPPPAASSPLIWPPRRPDLLTDGYKLLPGVLHAYKVTSSRPRRLCRPIHHDHDEDDDDHHGDHDDE